MGLRPGSQSPDCLVKSHIGSAYDNVKTVADNIDDVNLVANNMAYIRGSSFNFVQEELPDSEEIPSGGRWYIPSTGQVFVFYMKDPSTLGVWTETTNGL